MKIGELARIAKCTPDTIRFYEREGLLQHAERTEANYRTYSASHVERLRLIRNCRELDMTHDEVRALLRAIDETANSCQPINSLVDEHIHHVAERIDELIGLQTRLLALREKCQGEQLVDDCGIMHELTSKEAASRKTKKSHLG